MATDYQPGTVAIISDGHSCSGEWRAVKADKGWTSLDPSVGWVEDAQVVVVRPLVVLDLEDLGDELRSLATSLLRVQQASHGDKSAADPIDRNRLMSLVAQIEAQTKPARIDEPGLWGVVEADHNYSTGSREEYVRYPDGWASTHDAPIKWDDLIDPVLVREGLS